MVGARPGCFPSSSSFTIHPHSLSCIPFFFRPYFMKLWHDGCFGGGGVCRPSAGSALAVSSQ